MSKHKAGSKKQPFPVERPKIEIVGSTVPTFEVDCREVPWWFAIPEVGNRTHWAIYDPPEWRVTTVTDMQVVRLAKVHELDGVEINVDEWKAETGWMLSERLMYARLTDSTVEWIGLASLDDGARTIFTHMDDGFEERWGGAMVRHMEDLGAFVAQEDGSFRLNEHEPGCIGAGAFTVTVGDNSFECLRVIDIYREVDEKGQLMEAYLSQDGRSVLVRRYNGLRWHVDDGKPTWDEKLPDNDRLVIDGTAYVHWYDCLTSTALGIDAA